MGYTLFSTVGNSLYCKYPDPALLLPNKFRLCRSTLVSQENHIYAMNARGIRFFSNNYNGYSDRVLIPGLKYTIEVPVYNASFVAPSQDVAVRLSYSNTLNPTVKNDSARTVIGTQAVKLRSRDNIEIDPDNVIQEVHESRISADGTTVSDVGGNNEGHFAFSVLHVNYENMRKILEYGADNLAGASDGVLYASTFKTPSGGVKAAADSDIIDLCFLPITHSTWK